MNLKAFGKQRTLPIGQNGHPQNVKDLHNPTSNRG